MISTYTALEQRRLENSRHERAGLARHSTCLLDTLAIASPSLFEHGLRVSSLVERLVSRDAGISDFPAARLGLVSQLHDVGKLAISAHVLDRPARLTETEMDHVRQHAAIGANVFHALVGDANMTRIVRHHHEWWNGRGYPDGLKGHEIPQASRLIAVADAYDAMRSERPYRRPLAHDAAMTELHRCAGSQFDPAIVEVFSEVITAFRDAETPG